MLQNSLHGLLESLPFGEPLNIGNGGDIIHQLETKVHGGSLLVEGVGAVAMFVLPVSLGAVNGLELRKSGEPEAFPLSGRRREAMLLYVANFAFTDVR